MMAQEAVLVSGQNALGSNGSVSYSVGQITYSTQTGTTGTVAQGVQQPFEISTLSGAEFTAIELKVLAYPNPTKSVLTIAIGNDSFDGMQCELFDVAGKSLMVQPISASETILALDNLPSATYILKIWSNYKALKTFKIIKN
jgi:hypothetical protein